MKKNNNLLETDIKIVYASLSLDYGYTLKCKHMFSRGIQL